MTAASQLIKQFQTGAVWQAVIEQDYVIWMLTQVLPGALKIGGVVNLLVSGDT
jgi:hypothetical protein